MMEMRREDAHSVGRGKGFKEEEIHFRMKEGRRGLIVVLEGVLAYLIDRQNRANRLHGPCGAQEMPNRSLDAAHVHLLFRLLSVVHE